MLSSKLKRSLFLIVTFVIVAKSSLSAAQSVLKREDVKPIMRDLFNYHVEYKEMKPEMMKRSFYFYLEQFDILKAFLTEKEVAQFVNPSSKMLKEAVQQYNQEQYGYFEHLQGLIHKSIERARHNRAQIRVQVETQIANGKIEASDYELSFNYPKTDGALMRRQMAHMVRFIQLQERAAGYNVSKKDYKRMFDYYESRMREYENLFYVDPEAMDYEEQLEHNSSIYALKAMARSMDPHTAFFSPDEAKGMRSSLSKNCCGIGLVLQRDFRGVTVREVVEGGPAHRVGGIQPGDRIIAIDQHPIEQMNYKEVQQLLEGQEHSEVNLLIQKASASSDDQELHVTIQRAKLGLNQKLIETSTEPCPGGGIIGKIILNSFYDDQHGISASKDMRKAIEEFKQEGELKGVILDLRQNTGGFLMGAVEVAGLFMTNGVVVVAKFADGKEHYLRDLDGKRSFDGPLIVLTSRLSASSSEIVAGTLQDYGLGLIVGDPCTFGKASIQYQTLTIPNAKHYFKVTIGRYYTVSGRCPQIEGIKADISVPTMYYNEKIGERFLTYPLSKDEIEPAFNDSLKDLDPKAQEIFTRFYLPSLQKKTDQWRSMLPELKQRSAQRIASSTQYQLFLQQINGKGSSSYSDSGKDLQMTEAIYIMQDMIQMQSKMPKSS